MTLFLVIKERLAFPSVVTQVYGVYDSKERAQERLDEIPGSWIFRTNLNEDIEA